MIPALLGIVLAGLGLWILQPLRHPRRMMPTGSVDDARWKELVDAKHAVYRSILDLEFDRSVGKVAEEDYGILRHQHEAEALALLHEMDAMTSAAAGSSRPGEAPEAARGPEHLVERAVSRYEGGQNMEGVGQAPQQVPPLPPAGVRDSPGPVGLLEHAGVVLAAFLLHAQGPDLSGQVGQRWHRQRDRHRGQVRLIAFGNRPIGIRLHNNSISARD